MLFVGYCYFCSIYCIVCNLIIIHSTMFLSRTNRFFLVIHIFDDNLCVSYKVTLWCNSPLSISHVGVQFRRQHPNSYELYHLRLLQNFVEKVDTEFQLKLCQCRKKIVICLPGSGNLKPLARWQSWRGRYLVSALCGERTAGGAPDRNPRCSSHPTSDMMLAFRKYGVTSLRYFTATQNDVIS